MKKVTITLQIEKPESCIARNEKVFEQVDNFISRHNFELRRSILVPQAKSLQRYEIYHFYKTILFNAREKIIIH